MPSGFTPAVYLPVQAIVDLPGIAAVVVADIAIAVGALIIQVGAAAVADVLTAVPLHDAVIQIVVPQQRTVDARLLNVAAVGIRVRVVGEIVELVEWVISLWRRRRR